MIITGILSCNSSSDTKKNVQMDSLHQSAMHDSTKKQIDSIKEISHLFTHIDPKTTAAITALVNNYLELKNSLAGNNEEDAKKAGKEIVGNLEKIDKSILTAEQKKVFESEEGDLKENAEHISHSKIDHQREHFSALSQSIYTIVKYFGGGQPLYHIYCSKAGNDGAMWLSEVISSGNPYSGDLKDCNEVVEKIK
jgi:hypothetical protein